MDTFDNTTPDIERLKEYTRTKQAIAREIRSLQRYFTENKQEERVSACQELMVKLAEDRFTLAVLGQFKRGKSSLMNAVIGRDLLPTGVLPITSMVTVLRYGPEERLVIHREKALFPEKEPIDQLAQYVTEEANPGNQKRVKTVQVELPLVFLRPGLEFVDTPGVGSVIEANTLTTYQFLPQCDAVLFVTGVDGPLSRTEMDFLNQIRQYVRKMVLVVNKIDLLGDQERAETLRFIADHLAVHAAGTDVPVFPVSSRRGLAAKTTGDSTLYEDSGLKNLEEFLGAFLAQQKAATFLIAVIDKALRLFPESGLGSPGDSENCVLNSAKRHLDLIREQLQPSPESERLGRPGNSTLHDAEVSEEAPSDAALPVVKPTEEAKSSLDFRDSGCPICGYLGQRVFEFMTRWQYVLSYQPEVQTAFANEGGFCPLHTWQLITIGSPHGLSLGYPSLAARMSRQLLQLSQTPEEAGEAIRRLVPGPEHCRVCRFVKEEEESQIRKLAEELVTAEKRRVFAQSQGVCVRHLALLIDAAADPEMAQFLLSRSAKHFEEWAEDMQNFALKREAVRRALINRDEENAYYQAAAHLVGEKNICVPWSFEAD